MRLYLALMVLFGLPPATMGPTSLVLNVLVASCGAERRGRRRPTRVPGGEQQAAEEDQRRPAGLPFRSLGSSGTEKPCKGGLVGFLAY